MNQCQTRRSTVEEQADIRVIKYLVWYCQVNGSVVNQALEAPVMVRVTQDVMTESIGKISLRTVNRVLAQLEKKQIIHVKKGKIRISPEQYIQMSDLLKTRVYAEKI